MMRVTITTLATAAATAAALAAATPATAHHVAGHGGAEGGGTTNPSVTIADVVARTLTGNRLQIGATTSGASQLRFFLPGRDVKGREVRRSKGTRRWSATSRRRSGERVGALIQLRVKACSETSCRTSTVSVRIERG